MQPSFTLPIGSREKFLTLPAIITLLVALALQAALAEDKALVLEDNLKVLKADAPDKNYPFIGSNAPGQLFLPNRQSHGKVTTSPVLGAKVAVRRDVNIYNCEVAIAQAEPADMKLEAGTEFGFTFMAGNSQGANALYGADKSVTKNNSLTLHLYWENSPSASTRGTLIP